MKKLTNIKNIPIIRVTVSKAIVIAFVTAIITLFGTGVFNMTQAQEGASPSITPPSITPRSITPPSPTSPSPTSPSPTSPPTNPTVSSAVKSKICDPNNPKLSFVNTTESNICGLPKTIKNITTTTTIPTPKPISPLSPRSITPPSEPSPPEDIPGLP